MRNIIRTVLVLLILSSAVEAQKIEVKAKKHRISDQAREGYQTTITGNEDKISSAWYRHQRTLGRLKEEGNYIVVREADIDAGRYPLMPVYSKLTPSAEETDVWIGADVEGMDTDSAAVVSEKMRELLYAFTLEYYRKVAQENIEEAERGLNFTSKKHEKLMREEIELGKDSLVNVSEIKRLEGLLQEKSLEKEVISQKIIENKANQDSTLVDIEHLKKALELKKEKFKAIE